MPNIFPSYNLENILDLKIYSNWEPIMVTRILSIYKWSHIVSSQKLDFQEEQMIFNKIAENIDSQSINTISSAMVEQLTPW